MRMKGAIAQIEVSNGLGWGQVKDQVNVCNKVEDLPVLCTFLILKSIARMIGLERNMIPARDQGGLICIT
jgi:hypothetical protein